MYSARQANVIILLCQRSESSLTTVTVHCWASGRMAAQFEFKCWLMCHRSAAIAMHQAKYNFALASGRPRFCYTFPSNIYGAAAPAPADNSFYLILAFSFVPLYFRKSKKLNINWDLFLDGLISKMIVRSCLVRWVCVCVLCTRGLLHALNSRGIHLVCHLKRGLFARVLFLFWHGELWTGIPWNNKGSRESGARCVENNKRVNRESERRGR